MLLTSKKNAYNHNEYSLTMDESEFKQALNGTPLYRMTASANVTGEWTVIFKKFSKAKMRRMDLL